MSTLARSEVYEVHAFTNVLTAAIRPGIECQLESSLYIAARQKARRQKLFTRTLLDSSRNSCLCTTSIFHFDGGEKNEARGRYKGTPVAPGKWSSACGANTSWKTLGLGLFFWSAGWGRWNGRDCRVISYTASQSCKKRNALVDLGVVESDAGFNH